MAEVKRIDPIPPRELKTVEIDVEKKIFRVNGEDFSRVTGFSLMCSEPRKEEKDWFRVILNLESNISYTSEYDISGKETSKEEWRKQK